MPNKKQMRSRQSNRKGKRRKDLDYKFWRTQDIFYGDCHCKVLQTVIRTNGTGFVSIIVRSRDTNDTWHLEVELYDKNDNRIESPGKFDFNMPESENDYDATFSPRNTDSV
jgi:hypothetical protein